MKKLMYSFAIGFMAIVLTACGSNDEAKKTNDNDNSKTSQTDQQKDQEKQVEEMQKKLDEQKVDVKETVAIVNEKKILGSEYNGVLFSSQQQFQQLGQDPTTKEAAKQIKQQTIDSLVGQTLLLQEADRKGYKATNDEVNKQLDETKKQFKSDKELEAALKKAGMDMKQLETKIAENIKYAKYIEKEIVADEVTDEEIQKYYDQNASQGKDSGQETQKFEEVKSQIKQQLEQQKRQEMIAEKVDELKKDAKVDVKI
ncbi:SurA N-terminal domain-containing protein [Metabacillus idriensis]|uniref:SurA N-terminal domain-containing protein n=1 Tax=Metabacillus idriensis TaxID=324768 RepID=UPI0008A9BA11|nr:SurA N-terminal domain-containing protein [Metabacillus idriensis]MCM3597982.1 SurA N-terminal domain-containing protein [Metabacillus idriensis]OHR73651.1 peptidylprolyl isomerase [Bacillus sp. HMSC76G11]